MRPILTAKEFVLKELEDYISSDYLPPEIYSFMIEFAKMHREAIIQTIFEKGLSELTEWSGNPYSGEGSDYLSLELLEKAYPEDKIKLK